MFMLLENPLAVGTLGIMAALVSLGYCKCTGSKKGGQVLAAVVGVTVLMLLVERVVTTEREQIEATLTQMAADLERNDLPAILSHIHSDVPEVRTQAEIVMPSFIFEAVEIVRLWDIRLEGSGASRRAIAEFNVTVTGRDKDGSMEKGRVPRFVILTLKPQQEAWRVVDIEDRDPQQGFFATTAG